MVVPEQKAYYLETIAWENFDGLYVESAKRLCYLIAVKNTSPYYIS